MDDYCTVKAVYKQPLSKRPNIGFQDQLSLNAGQKYCRMLQEEHSAVLSTFIKLPFVINIFVLSIFEWPFYTNFQKESSKDVLILDKIFQANFIIIKFYYMYFVFSGFSSFITLYLLIFSDVYCTCVLG